MITHNVDFCKKELRLTPLTPFHLNRILLLMMQMNKNNFHFHFIREILEQRVDPLKAREHSLQTD